MFECISIFWPLILNEKALSFWYTWGLKVDVLLADMYIVESSNFGKVIDHYFIFQQSDDPETAFKMIITTFTKISNNCRNIVIKTFVANCKRPLLCPEKSVLSRYAHWGDWKRNFPRQKENGRTTSNRAQVHEMVLKGSSPLSTHASSSTSWSQSTALLSSST